jgi:hypothetical protein
MIVLLGIDDTDDASSRGTGYQARRLGTALAEHGLAEFRAVTRHQLLVDSQINYTSRNSSACLLLDTLEASIPDILDFACTDLESQCAAEANSGVCIAAAPAVDSAIQELGSAAKFNVLAKEMAVDLANQRGIGLEPVAGTGDGMIGALAAVGLHKSGDDGRFIWLPRLRELTGPYTVGELKDILQVEISSSAGKQPPLEASIDIGDWVRPVLREGRPVLLAEKEKDSGKFRWRLTGKPTVKSLSN